MPEKRLSEEEALEKEALAHERSEILQQIEGWLEMPMLVLGFVWLVLTVIDLTVGLNPLLNTANTVIWVIFILDFALRLTVAPDKLAFLKSSWLTAISLAVPALRLLRIARLARLLQATRAVRGFRLVRVVGSINRGMRALGRSMGRRGFGYVVALTAIVVLVGAAGIFAFENPEAGGGITSYAAALWWAAMMITTMGSDYWPQTPEGRILTLILAVYAFAVFGYVTATLATFFIGREASDEEAELPSAKSIQALHAEIAALRVELQALQQRRTEP